MKIESGHVKPGIKLYLSDGESEGMFGDGKWRLLKSIEEEGSIRKAAEKLGRGYRKAWGDIKRTEQSIGRKLVRKTRGGPAGGTTELTDFGRELLAGWERYREAVLKDIDGAFELYLAGLLERNEDER
ncbi:MAG: LysR family transcriptional regulator [Candidatus Krumholzibacteria bacterium]|nr:LysR family transcriptional regulator [Candidatus Krumholzibacteria bacterium]